MAEELKGTEIEKGKGSDGYLEVDELIRETLEESKKLEKEPPPQAPAKKEELRATPLGRPTPLPTSTPLPTPTETPAPKYEETFREYKTGDIVKGTVLKVDPGGVLVDIKYKADGLILPEELSDKSGVLPAEVVKVGDVIDVYIENLEDKEGHVVLSKKRADEEGKWRTALDAYRNKKILEGKVIQAVKGGLVVDCEGIRGFIPASQVAKKAEISLDTFVGQPLPIKIIEINRRQGKVVLSHKLAAGEKEKYQAGKILDEVEVGQVRRGTVSSLKSFGAFVDIGGIEGLIHLSELSWKRVKHPSEVLKIGEEIDVFVLGVDRVSKKVALGLKELQPDPWVMAADLYKPGQVVKGKVLRFAKFGAFVELEQGLEGLVHISEISKDPISKPEDALKIGDEIPMKILRVIPEEQKIGLSIKELQKENEKAVPAGRQEKIQEVSVTDEKKVTIGDILAEKERARAEKEAEIEAEASAEEEVT